MVDDDMPEDVKPEPYQALYRRYRPQRFSEVLGQEHVTRALLNSVREGRVAHAYLFSGPRGTGKTSTARILAMALNCENPVEGEPCGVCASCVGIRRGSSLDVHELDAASNRKLDEMRDLLSRVALGTIGRWKVYIVDEVHQLTSDAASALLKTLEEPPGHVIFVLATTDPQKVMPTIRSRTQHFEFHLLGSDTLVGLLGDINTRASLGVAPEALDLVVRRGHGSARDALSVLDQVAAAGTVDDEMGVVTDIVDALADRDVGRVLVGVAECMSAGRDPRRLAVDLLDHLRNGFLASQARGLVLLPDDAAAEAEAQARRFGLASLVRAMEVIGQAATDMRDSVDPRVALEVALVRVAFPAADLQPAALLSRIEQLEQRLAAGGSVRESTAPIPATLRPRTGGEGPSEGVPSEIGRAERPASRTEASRPSERPGPRPAASPAPDRPVPRPAGSPPSGRPSLGAPPMAPRPSLGGRPRSGLRAAPAAGDAPPAGPGSHADPGPTRETSQTEAPRPTSDGQGAPNGPADRGAADRGPAVGGAADSGPAVGGAAVGDGGTAGGEAEMGGEAAADGKRFPSRDELTKAWGDVILPALPPGRLKAFVLLGRFVTAEAGTAAYALPDGGLLTRAQEVRADFEASLSGHFGQRIPVRLVLDEVPVSAAASPGAPEASTPTAAKAVEDPEDYVLAEMEDVDAAVVSPEQRLLQAFPGAEEVTP